MNRRLRRIRGRLTRLAYEGAGAASWLALRPKARASTRRSCSRRGTPSPTARTTRTPT